MELSLKAINAFLSGCALAGFTFVVFFGIRWYRLDAYRQRLFDLRDELFSYALSGHMSFQDERYRDLRLRINGLIRYANTATLVSFLGSALSPKTKEKQDAQHVSRVLAEPKDEVGREILRLHFRLVILTLLKIFYVPFSFEKRFSDLLDNNHPPAKRFVSESVEPIENHAVESRMRDLAACESRV